MPQIIPVEEPIINSIAPTIYIDSIDYETAQMATGSINKDKVFFSFVDENNNWINNKNIFDSLNVHFKYYDLESKKYVTLFKDSLNNVKNKGYYNNNFLYGSCEFVEPNLT